MYSTPLYHIAIIQDRITYIPNPNMVSEPKTVTSSHSLCSACLLQRFYVCCRQISLGSLYHRQKPLTTAIHISTISNTAIKSLSVSYQIHSVESIFSVWFSSWKVIWIKFFLIFMKNKVESKCWFWRVGSTEHQEKSYRAVRSNLARQFGQPNVLRKVSRSDF